MDLPVLRAPKDSSLQQRGQLVPRLQPLRAPMVSLPEWVLGGFLLLAIAVAMWFFAT